MWAAYADKFRRMMSDGTDLATEARFLDMLLPRAATVLDVGCGTGSTVAHLRAAGHSSWGVDPDGDVLAVAAEAFDAAWFRRGAAGDLTPSWLAAQGLPTSVDAVTLLGNVLAFLPADGAADLARRVASLLRPGGLLVVGTSTAAGGITGAELGRAASAVGLRRTHRFADWHLAAWTPDSAWTVTLFQNGRGTFDHGAPDGMFVLGRR